MHLILSTSSYLEDTDTDTIRFVSLIFPNNKKFKVVCDNLSMLTD